MRSWCLAIVFVLAACKEKKEAAPAPAPTPSAPPAAAPKAPAPEAPKPAEPVAQPAAIKPAGGITTTDDYEHKAFDLMDKLTTVFERSGTNCEKLADNLEVFLDENKAAIEGTQAFGSANPSADDELEAKMMDKGKIFIAKANPGMQACQKNARVKAALAKLPQ